MLQSHEPEGIGHDTLKHVATMQIQRLALVEQHALGIRFHALYNDVGSPGGIRFLETPCTHFEFTIVDCTWTGGEKFVKELMMILGLTAQQIVKMARSRNSSIRSTKYSRPALEIAEGVMGHVAWDEYSNSKYKENLGNERISQASWRQSHQKKEIITKTNTGRSLDGMDIADSTSVFPRRRHKMAYGHRTRVVVAAYGPFYQYVGRHDFRSIPHTLPIKKRRHRISKDKDSSCLDGYFMRVVRMED